ncbi:hypothetical protein Trydic_g6511 [Trypoxylus dichotomus]
MVNVNTNNPLVQVGNFVFQGTYEDFLGTKVFFMEDKNHKPNDNVFVKETLIHLKYVVKTAKVMQLKWRKMPANVVQTDNIECLDLKFRESYNEVLTKLEKGALDINDIVYDANYEKTASEKNKASGGNDDMEVDVKDSKQSEKVENIEEPLTDLNKYTLLKKFAQMPVKQKEMQKVYEVDKENLVKIDDASNFSVLTQLFLQDVISKDSKAIKDENDLSKYVNVQKSIEDGIILKSENGKFTEDEKALLLSEQLLEYKRLLKMKSIEALCEVDKFGRTFKDRYRLLKQLTKQIWYYTYLNCADYM